MRISWKIFIITYCMLVVSIGAVSFYLLNQLYNNDINRIINQAEQDNRSMYTYAITLDSEDADDTQKSLRVFANAMSKEKNDIIMVGSKDEIEIAIDKTNLNENTMSSSIIKKNGSHYVQVVSNIGSIYMVNQYSLETVLEQRDVNLRFYRNAVIFISAIMAVILYLCANYITRPIVKLTNMAEQIAEGDYSVRLDTRMKKMKSKEVKQLGETMNLMAEHTCDNISELEEMVKKREEFMGDFTHEIKTPLTSIIGYGDMLRTYDLTAEKRRKYGEYIYSEGKRLEKLSLNLMNIIVLNNTDVEFKDVNITDIFVNIRQNTLFWKEKYNVNVEFDIDDGIIKAEPALYGTMIINFIDNACKSYNIKSTGNAPQPKSTGNAPQLNFDCNTSQADLDSSAQQIEANSSESQPKSNISTVWVTGRVASGQYIINVIDNGKGIPKDQLQKIMEPFYMVDKSRTRIEGGAGLGLALCKKIADIHGARIEIDSTPGMGTTVSLIIMER